MEEDGVSRPWCSSLHCSTEIPQWLGGGGDGKPRVSAWTLSPEEGVPHLSIAVYPQMPAQWQAYHRLSCKFKKRKSQGVLSRLFACKEYRCHQIYLNRTASSMRIKENWPLPNCKMDGKVLWDEKYPIRHCMSCTSSLGDLLQWLLLHI